MMLRVIAFIDGFDADKSAMHAELYGLRCK